MINFILEVIFIIHFAPPIYCGRRPLWRLELETPRQHHQQFSTGLKIAGGNNYGLLDIGNLNCKLNYFAFNFLMILSDIFLTKNAN